MDLQAQGRGPCRSTPDDEVVDGVPADRQHHGRGVAAVPGGVWVDDHEDDIFFYVYGLLHSSDYRETYAADLKKMLPRIPLVEDAQPFIDAGRKLSGTSATSR